MLEVLCGRDENDSTSLEDDVPAFSEQFTADIKGLKVGMPKGFLDNLDPEVKKPILQAADKLKALGAELVEVEVPHAKYSAPCYYIITSAEASSNLARFDGIRYGYGDPSAKNLNDYYELSRAPFGPEVKKRIIIGATALKAENYAECYLQAVKVRELIKQDFVKAFKQADVILRWLHPLKNTARTTPLSVAPTK